MRNSLPVEFVGNSNFNFIQHIQNVKFCQSNAVGTRDDNNSFSCMSRWLCNNGLHFHMPLTLWSHWSCEHIGRWQDPTSRSAASFLWLHQPRDPLFAVIPQQPVKKNFFLLLHGFHFKPHNNEQNKQDTVSWSVSSRERKFYHLDLCLCGQLRPQET